MSPWPRRLAGAYLELRVIPVLLWSFSGVTLGTALGFRDGPGSHGWFAAALVIGLLIQGVIAHTVNEIADWRSGTDRDPAPRVLSGGSKVLAADLLTERGLAVLGGAAALLAVALGTVTAAARGWWLLALGALGIAGAVAYTLSPVRAAYRPYAGEALAFACVGACVLGGYGVQRGGLTGDAVLVGAAHASFCVAMLMLHHRLDRGPDSRARPPKMTTVVRLGPSAPRYGLAWAILAAALGAAAAASVDIALLPFAACAALAAVAHSRARHEDPRSVTMVEAGVIALGVVGALASALWLAGSLAWVLAVPGVLVPLELLVARRVLGPVRLPTGGDDPPSPHDRRNPVGSERTEARA